MLPSICFPPYVGMVRKWGQNHPASKLVSSKGALARNTEINIELDATRIYNTGKKKKKEHTWNREEEEVAPVLRKGG